MHRRLGLLATRASELPDLVKGTSECAYGLPVGVYGAIWIHDSVIHLRLRTRKHRPNGSWLRRPCSCVGGTAKLFPVHALDELLDTKVAGQRLFDWSVSDLMANLRRLLTLLGVDGTKHFTSKCFRAGRATELAQRNVTLGEILQLREWKGPAALSYLKT